MAAVQGKKATSRTIMLQNLSEQGKRAIFLPLGLEIFLPPVLWELFTPGAGFTCSFSPAPHGHFGEFCNIPGKLFSFYQ